MSEIQMIFQDPIDSLDPRMTVEDIIQEGLKIKGSYNKKKNHEKVVEALEEVGLIPDFVLVIHMNSLVVSVSVSESLVLWLWNLSSCCVMSQSQLWMSPFVLRLSICLMN